MTLFPHHMKRCRPRATNAVDAEAREYNIQGFRGDKFYSETVLARSYSDASQIAMRRFNNNDDISVKLREE